MPWPLGHHPQTLPLLQQLMPSPEAGLGSFHPHRLLGQGEDLCEVEGALSSPPTLGLGVASELWVFC